MKGYVVHHNLNIIHRDRPVIVKVVTILLYILEQNSRLWILIIKKVRVFGNPYILNVNLIRLSKSLTNILTRFSINAFSETVGDSFDESSANILRSLSLIIPGRLQY